MPLLLTRLGCTLSLAILLCAGSATADVPHIAPVQALVAMILGDLGKPDLLLGPGSSPHHHAMRPSEARALKDADIVVWIGPSLMPGLEKSVQIVATQAQILTLADVSGTTRHANRKMAVFGDVDKHDDHDHDKSHDDHGHDDHGDHAHRDHAHDDGHDHAHGPFDPHLWLDPANAALWLNAVEQTLSDADPDHAATYRNNAASALARITAATATARATLAPVRQMRFVVGHDAYEYFEAAFGLTPLGAITLSDDSAPSPARIAVLGDAIQDAGVTCVLVESGFKPGLIAALQADAALDVTVIDPLGAAPQAEILDTPEMISGIATKIANCLNNTGSVTKP